MTGRPDAARNGGNGHWAKDVDAAERSAQAALMRSRGMYWKDIAAQLGYASPGAAYDAAQRFWIEQPKQTVAQIREEFRMKLDGLEQELRDIIARPHYVVASVPNLGPELVKGPPDAEGNAQYLIDDAPIMNAVDKIRALVETQLKFMPGVASATKVQVITDDDLADALEAERSELAQLESQGDGASG
jgi:hypothetical protein